MTTEMLGQCDMSLKGCRARVFFTLESAALRETAGDLDFSTFYGRFKIDPVTGRQIGRSVVIVQWQGGRKVVVWPPERSQSQLQYPWRGAGLQPLTAPV